LETKDNMVNYLKLTFNRTEKEPKYLKKHCDE